jgi:hypothetical protein
MGGVLQQRLRIDRIVVSALAQRTLTVREPKKSVAQLVDLIESLRAKRRRR